MSRKRRFEQLALPHLDAAYRLACRLASDPVEAEDLVQEAFMRAYRAFDGFELREFGVKPWLLRILHNTFYTTRGRRRREPTLLDDLDFAHAADELANASAEPPTIDGIDWDAFDEELKQSVERLPEEYRIVILLWAVEELSYKEIAQVVGCPVGTVMSRLYRARQTLKASLAAYARTRRVPMERYKS